MTQCGNDATKTPDITALEPMAWLAYYLLKIICSKKYSEKATPTPNIHNPHATSQNKYVTFFLR
jgi:hypothetical protein